MDKHESPVPALVVAGTPETVGMLRMRLNEIDLALHNAKYMAEFAYDLVEALDGHGAPEGYFKISMDKGNRLAFCCYNLSKRLEELIELCWPKPA
jgi:uncharacterized membrane protein affecting hemolysin expression